jgi:hypothetical protein
VARPEGFEPPTSGLESEGGHLQRVSSGSQLVGIARGRSGTEVDASHPLAALADNLLPGCYRKPDPAAWSPATFSRNRRREALATDGRPTSSHSRRLRAPLNALRAGEV